MQKKATDITLLCKVVDNFGDIGVVYRLARALKELSDAEECRNKFTNDNIFLKTM